MNFAALNDGIATRTVRRLWRKCIAQIENAEMPPVEAKQLSVVDLPPDSCEVHTTFRRDDRKDAEHR